MFALFDRQEPFFEFEMTEPSGIKWACLFAALVTFFETSSGLCYFW
jgi:hypothetical protein